MSDVHTSTMEKCKAKKLISIAESYEDKVYLSKLLGLKLPQPYWYKIALQEGWKPPKGLKVL